MWFIHQYINVLKDETKEKDSSMVIPNLVDAVNKNDREILRKVDDNQEVVDKLQTRFKKKLNQIETNRRNINNIATNVGNIHRTVNEDTNKSLATVKLQLASNNDIKIQKRLGELDSEWLQTTSNLIDEMHESVGSNYVLSYDFNLFTDSNNSNLKKLESAMNITESNFHTYSNNTLSNIDQIRRNTESNTSFLNSNRFLTQSNLDALSNTMSNYLSNYDFNLFTESNNSNLNRLESAINITESNFNTYSNNTSSNINQIRRNTSNITILDSRMLQTQSNLATLSNTTMSLFNSSYLVDTTYTTNYVTKSTFESLSNTVINDISYSNDQLTFTRNNDSNIAITLSNDVSFQESNLSLSLDSNNGLCVKYGDSYSNCISKSNLQQIFYSKSEYPLVQQSSSV